MRYTTFLPAISIVALAATATADDVHVSSTCHSGPVAFGVGDVRSALEAAGHQVVERARDADVRIVAGCVGEAGVPEGVDVPAPAESFAIVPDAGHARIAVFGRDATGTMYGLLELAEQVSMGADLREIRPVKQSPFVEFRAPNPFFSLPDPDLSDWDSWWFLSEDFWRTYLDMLARSRFNWVDLHGMLHIRGQWSFPAIFPYFVDSPSFPDVGIDDAQKAKHLAMLQHVVRMAKDHGIRIALMSYTTSWNVPGAPKAPYEETEPNLALYTRECVAALLRSCPALGMIGFRIGESGKSEGFFKISYVPGVVDSGVSIPIHTRTWLSTKSKILELADAYKGPLDIEIKYNGEHYGLPYQVSGGRMTSWHSYSFQDYCVPPKPYDIVWQNRASGTHRLWRWGSPEWVARTVRSFKLGGGIGFSLEPLNAYRPNYDYYHKSEALKWFRWVPERDWFWSMLWGRLSYNPDLGDDVLLAALARRFGPDAAQPMLETSRQMSLVIPLIYSAHCQGPDHLNMAPELETGGSLADFGAVPPLDTLAMQSITEFVQRTVSGSPSARTSPLEMADMIQAAAERAAASMQEAKSRATSGLAELADWEADVTCLGHFGRYYAEKIRAATHLELYRATGDPVHIAASREHARESVRGWQELARVTDEYYHPFVESMRPRTEQFHWKDLTDSVVADLAVPDTVVNEVAGQGAEIIRGVHPKPLSRLSLRVSVEEVSATPEARDLRVRVVSTQGAAAMRDGACTLYHKPLLSEVNWRKTRMAWRNGAFEHVLRVTPLGAQWAVEVVAAGAGACWPDWRKETPYRVVEAWDGPVPPATPGALPDLSRADLSRERFSAIVCGRVASALNAASAAQKAALLAQVSEGQTLVLFDQDYPGFDLSWLPGGVRGTDADMDAFTVTQSHPILKGVPSEVRYPKIVNDALEGGDETWLKLTEPWGLGVRPYGKGEVVLIQLRVEETYDQRSSALIMRNLLGYARRGGRLPVLVLDEGNGELLTAFGALGFDDYVTVHALGAP